MPDNSILNGERPKGFPLRLAIKQGCLLMLLPFNVELEVLGKEKKEKASKLERNKYKDHCSQMT